MKQKPTINFFTFVNKEYYHFVLPYIFSIMKNTNHFVEVVVEDRKEFYNVYGKKLANLEYILTDISFQRITISDIKYYNENLDNIIPNTKRFLIQPLRNWTNYTYITDCDMLIKDNGAIEHNIKGMKEHKTCFFNIKRENRDVLSGIHFVKNSEYYPKIAAFLALPHHSADINKLGDEGFLFNMIAGAIGDPEKLTEGNERILPGDHLSPNRNKTYPHIKAELIQDDQWAKAFKQFDKKFNDLMS